MAKLKLVWVECPKCEGEGGEDIDAGGWGAGWLDCSLCDGEGKAQMAVPEEAK